MKLLELVKNGFFLISNAGNSDALFEEVYGLLYSEGYVKKEFRIKGLRGRMQGTLDMVFVNYFKIIFFL